MRRSANLVVAVVVSGLVSNGCRDRRGSAAAPLLAGGVVLQGPACTDSLRPTTAAPAEGLWTLEGAAHTRVAAMVGPTRVWDGETRITRRVETIELRADSSTLRLVMDTASVRLELLPAVTSALGPGVALQSKPEVAPAAVYVVSPRVVLASYEPCFENGSGPRLRYLRRDAEGRTVVDAMLRRTSAGG